MAQKIKDIYPSQVTTGDAGWPDGKPRNIQGGVQGTGTPFEEKLFQDYEGSRQALFAEAGITPSGVSDKVGQSDFVDALKKVANQGLVGKIFQSPTDGGLTEIQTRTVSGGESYAVRRISDDSLATIYSDAAGTIEIVQNGTSNVSGSDGVVEFFVADGDYYVEVNSVRSSFDVMSEIQSRQAIEAAYKAQGYNNVFFFEDGFTYTESNDVGIYSDGTAWTYADTGALPVTVAAGTVPSEGVYKIVKVKASSVELDNGSSVQSLSDKAAVNDSNGQLSILGGAVRYSTEDGLFMINDSAHSDFGITGIEALNDYEFRIHYDHDFTKVGSIVAGVDEALGFYGLYVGASVGIDYATFKMFAPLRFTARGDGVITNISPMWDGFVTLSTIGTNSVIFNVPTRLNTNLPMLSPVSVSNSPIMNTAISSWSANAVKVTNYSAASNNTFCRIKSNGTSFSVSNSSVGINVSSVTWDDTSKEAVVTHDAVQSGTGGRQVSAGITSVGMMPNVSYIPALPTQTRVGFTNLVTGLKQESQTSSMDVVMSFLMASTPTSEAALVSSSLFTVDCGICAVPIQALGQVSLANVWVFGAMNK